MPLLRAGIRITYACLQDPGGSTDRYVIHRSQRACPFITSPFLMMDDRHPMATQPIILLKSLQNAGSLYSGLVKSHFFGHGEEFPWCLTNFRIV
jgi:hypothetical protein